MGTPSILVTNPQLANRIRELYGEGKSLREMAMRLALEFDKDFNRNQISGYISRLKLKPEDFHRPPQPAGLMRGRPAKEEGCRFIEGEPDYHRRGEAIYCNAPKVEGDYCAGHAQVMWPTGKPKCIPLPPQARESTRSTRWRQS